MFTPHHVSRVTCHVSHVMYHLSPVTCRMSRVRCHPFYFFTLKKIKIGGASRWRVCYQRGLPCLVSDILPLTRTRLSSGKVAIILSQLIQYNILLSQNPLERVWQYIKVKCKSQNIEKKREKIYLFPFETAVALQCAK